MAGPMQMYLYVHDSILREVADLEDRSRDLNRDDPDEVGRMASRLEWFHKMVKKHEDAEEAVLFPALDERISFVTEAYAYDHDDFEDHVFGGIRRALSDLARANGGGRKESAELFYRHSVALHEHMRLHIAKENELLLPKLEREFDVSEQAEIAGAMAGLFEPSLMAELVAFMYRGQTLQDRIGMVGFLRNILPADVFQNLAEGLKAMGEADWGQVERGLQP